LNVGDSFGVVIVIAAVSRAGSLFPVNPTGQA
jgi:hypothetical protein